MSMTLQLVLYLIVMLVIGFLFGYDRDGGGHV